MMQAPVIVTATPPTPNGDMHVGHLSGPYLNADVFVRAMRARGQTVRYVTGGDDNQSYLTITALKRGERPGVVADMFNQRIVETLARLEIDLDHYSLPDAAYRNYINEFFHGLLLNGHLVPKTRNHWYCEETGQFLYEGYTRGHCPNCLALSYGNICETCGHPNHPGDLIGAESSLARRQHLVLRPLTLLYLEVERYRDDLAVFHAQTASRWRPHLRALQQQLMARSLLDLPVSFPGDWGIPVEATGFSGQIWNSWAEMLPALMLAASRADLPMEAGTGLVQFLGFDNAYWFCIAHPALAIAAGRLDALPSQIITNEFYLLNEEKFSTSRNHAIWGADFLGLCPSTHARFYLARTNPELHQTNFSPDTMVRVVNGELVGPWNALWEAYLQLEQRFGSAPGEGPAAAELHACLDRAVHCIWRSYAQESFSLRNAAAQVTLIIQLLVKYAKRGEEGDGEKDGTVRLKVLRHGLRQLSAAAAPLLPAFCASLRVALDELQSGALWEEHLTTVRLPSIEPQQLEAMRRLLAPKP